MEQVASEMVSEEVKILFQPHVGPFDRGIFSTVYCQPKESVTSDKLHELFKDFYKSEHFVEVCNNVPTLKSIVFTNYCHVFPTLVKGKIVVFDALDNICKGASGQAIQNMNIIFGLDETLGLL
jgi:N-acetyl-gamma-glutamyl-phosphate reductase